MEFTVFKTAVRAQMEKMFNDSSLQVFKTKVGEMRLWSTYLGSFPEGTDPVFRTNTEHDCYCCRSFIKNAGGIVAVNAAGERSTIWDVDIGGYYQVVANALANLVRAAEIENIFLHTESDVGTDRNNSLRDDGTVEEWKHFHFTLPPSKCASEPEINRRLSDLLSRAQVFKRGLLTITPSAVDTVIELVEQGSLYRGSEHLSVVQLFKETQAELLPDINVATPDILNPDIFWRMVVILSPTVLTIRNSAIGTLLLDLSTDMEVDDAVRKYEKVVAPENYQRSSAGVTAGMIAKAKEKVVGLGLAESLPRRPANVDDISPNDIIYIDRNVEVNTTDDPFDVLEAKAPVSLSRSKKVETVDIDTFLQTILPKADSLEVLFERRHFPNLMTLVAPVDPNAPPLFKWSNGFSWTYNGDVTDSLKERVKQAGGDITGDLQFTLSWFNTDDLDAWAIEPDKTKIYFSCERPQGSTGWLDVDMNSGYPYVTDAVEHITWPDRNRLKEGKYKFIVHQYQSRSSSDVGFEAQLDFDDEEHTFFYDSKVSGQVTVATLDYSHAKGFTNLKVGKDVKTTGSGTANQQEEWGITTQTFHKVSMVMNSPNHWGGHTTSNKHTFFTGNKHTFFILEGCKTDQKIRGYFNEYLASPLKEHRKVFERLGAEMMAEPTDDQLSGLGFSSTVKNSVLCRVTGSFTRTLKVTF